MLSSDEERRKAAGPDPAARAAVERDIERSSDKKADGGAFQLFSLSLSLSNPPLRPIPLHSSAPSHHTLHTAKTRRDPAVKFVVGVPTKKWQNKNQQTPSSNAIVMTYNATSDKVLRSRGNNGRDPDLGFSKKDPTQFPMLKVSTLSSKNLQWFTPGMDSETDAEELCLNINNGTKKKEDVDKWYVNGVEQVKE